MNYFIDNDRNINLDTVIFFQKTEINTQYLIDFKISESLLIQWEFIDENERNTCYDNLIKFVTI